MLGDIIIAIKKWWKQNVMCHHKYVFKHTRYGEYGWYECSKCGKTKTM